MILYILRDPIDKTVRYVGITSKTASQRLARHIKDAKAKLRRGQYLSRKEKWLLDLDGQKIQPIIEIVEENLSEYEAEIKERELIKLHGRLYDGGLLFNVQLGGHYHSKEATPWNRGLKGCHSVEFIENNRKMQPNSKSTYVWHKDGRYVGCWISIRQVSEELGLDRRCVMRCLNSKSSYFQSHKGYVFSHTPEKPEIYNHSHESGAPQGKWNRPIVAYKDGHEQVFSSVKAASEALQIGRQMISNTLIGRQKTTNGYIFKYLEHGSSKRA